MAQETGTKTVKKKTAKKAASNTKATANTKPQYATVDD